MLALHTTNLAPGLTMQPHSLPPTPSNANKPLITGASPQFIPMVPQSQFLIRGGYTLFPPLAAPLNMEGGFSGLAPLHPLGGLTRPITAIPYYQPTELYHQRRGGGTNGAEEGGNHGLRRVNTSMGQSADSVSETAPSPPPLTTLTPSHISAHSPVDEASLSLSRTRQTSLPTSLDLSSDRSPAGGGAISTATTPDHTPQAAMPRLISVAKSPMDPQTDPKSVATAATPTATPTISDVKREPSATAVNDSAYTCSRPKSADAVAKETSFSGGGNPYPINALIDVPASLGHGSRTSSLSSSISSFRFGGSLNKLWASQLSLSNKVNMKSTG